MRAIARLSKLKNMLDARSRWLAGLPAYLAHMKLLNGFAPAGSFRSSQLSQLSLLMTLL